MIVQKAVLIVLKVLKHFHIFSLKSVVTGVCGIFRSVTVWNFSCLDSCLQYFDTAECVMDGWVCGPQKTSAVCTLHWCTYMYFWSNHETDLRDRACAMVYQLICDRWPAINVQFRQHLKVHLFRVQKSDCIVTLIFCSTEIYLLTYIHLYLGSPRTYWAVTVYQR